MTEEVKTLFGGQDVEFSVEICEEEIENARRVLISAAEADDNFISEFRMSTQAECEDKNAYKTLGDAHLKKEEYDDAISYSTKCLAIAQESGDKVAEMNAYMMLGNAHLMKEEYDDAISYSTKCLAIAQESGDKVVEMKALILLGNAHLDEEEYDAAHSHFTEDMTIARRLEDNHNVTYFGIRINGIYEMVGLSEGYSELLSLKAFLKKLPDGVQKRFFYSFFDYVCYKEKDKYEEAISCLETCMALGKNIINKVEYRGLLWDFKHDISELYVLLGEYDKGIQYQQEALDVARKEGSKSKQAMSHLRLGEVYYKLKQFENTEKSLKESLTCYELIFIGLKQNDRFKIAFIDKYKEAFKTLLKVLIETNKKEEALVLSDHYRAEDLKDLLVSSYEMKKEQTADEDLQYADVQSLVSSCNYTLLFYSMCLEELNTFVVEAGNKLGFSVQHLEYCDSCLDKLVDKTYDDMKVHQVEKCEDRSLDVMRYSKANKNPKEDELTQLLFQEIQKRLSEQCCVCRGNPSENCDESSLTNGLKILYQKLITNIKCLIKQDEMVIIPEGPLCRLPFAALRDPDTGQYLSETKRIRMAPSISSLKLLQEYPVEQQSKNEALIIGAAVVGPVMLDGVETKFEFLDGAIEEADGIAIMLGARPLLSAYATKPVVIKRLQEGASVVHIAAYGSLEKATIVLAPSPEIRASKIPDEEDYMLTMADVQQTQVRAQLVVLSCCHSGRGDIKAEGIVGMCRAFLASGARAVVGSLWKIDDKATLMFMKTFYKYLRDGRSASTSLHLTMNDMRRTPQYSEPKYWAPFFLMGDDVTIQFKD
ncbi:tetratricopeptide repeat protein 28-like [Actinia tenebrosa]|uniref:Tetratricopeptide repeat protein 28-like n=1 Tax=Actinia tenebrosa TaxID=6105 RepID=A0A6P8HCP9_ACTTE|nr:tetratricopeptide repeat protein 28-like [Actinia tenebrosa]